MPPHASEVVTEGFRVRAVPMFLPDRSDPEGSHGTPCWVFGYDVRMTNEGRVGARLLTRKWRVIDARGDVQEIEGAGVVGRHPDLEPGQSYEYSSFCPLRTPWGTMEGHYVFEDRGGRRFQIQIGRFYLVAPGR
ncbi:MAG: Co2+/Mg2+ efflux protein ApaG [Phycisphaerae bacterium]|nr:Co2+/Mg2+ efflux protein ApaG [Phycisphaerae bacterium]